MHYYTFSWRFSYYTCRYQQIVRYYMDQDDYDSVIDSCKRLGEQDSHVWVMALSYFAKREDNCKTQMEEVLRNIDQQKLLPPLLVIQTLANSRVCTLGVVKVSHFQSAYQNFCHGKWVRMYTMLGAHAVAIEVKFYNLIQYHTHLFIPLVLLYFDMFYSRKERRYTLSHR